MNASPSATENTRYTWWTAPEHANIQHSDEITHEEMYSMDDSCVCCAWQDRVQKVPTPTHVIVLWFCTEHNLFHAHQISSFCHWTKPHWASALDHFDGLHFLWVWDQHSVDTTCRCWQSSAGILICSFTTNMAAQGYPPQTCEILNWHGMDTAHSEICWLIGRVMHFRLFHFVLAVRNVSSTWHNSSKHRRACGLPWRWSFCHIRESHADEAWPLGLNAQNTDSPHKPHTLTNKVQHWLFIALTINVLSVPQTFRWQQSPWGLLAPKGQCVEEPNTYL